MELMVTYMEMTAGPSSLPRPSPADKLTIAREFPSRQGYLSLYSAIGESLQWDSRLRMDPDALNAVLSRPSTHVYILRQDSLAVGLAEFLKVGERDVELVHFGLIPSSQGKGLGGFFLDRVLRMIWLPPTQRIWLHTDTNDSAAAIPAYIKAGFHPYLSRLETFPD